MKKLGLVLELFVALVGFSAPALAGCYETNCHQAVECTGWNDKHTECYSRNYFQQCDTICHDDPPSASNCREVCENSSCHDERSCTGWNDKMTECYQYTTQRVCSVSCYNKCD